MKKLMLLFIYAALSFGHRAIADEAAANVRTGEMRFTNLSLSELRQNCEQWRRSNRSPGSAHGASRVSSGARSRSSGSEAR